MIREKQPYLVNPPLALNPFEVIRVPSHKLVAKTDKHGRFVKVGSLTKHRKHKAKKIGRKTAAKLFKKAKKIKLRAAKHILRHVKRHVKRVKRVTKLTAKRGHKISEENKRKMQLGLKAWRDRQKKFKKLSSIEKRTYKALLKEAGLKNPIMLVNSKRRKSMRKYRRNPLVKMLSGSEVKGVGQLALDGALIVAGVTIGKLSMDALTSRFAVMQKPMVRMGSSLAIATLVYVAGSRTKKVPARVVNMIALGVLLPAVTDGIDMLKGMITGGGVKTVAYQGDLNAYVPQQGTGVYLPQTSLGDDYGSKY